MDRKDVIKLKRAARNMKSENDTFYIKGKRFSCRWTGHSFSWTINGRTYENISVKEVIEWIADGEYIEDYCYDYGG